MDGNYIYGLVGKNKHDIDLLDINSTISSLNTMGAGIIDLKMRDNKINITIIGNEINKSIYRYFPEEYTIVTNCGNGICPTKVSHTKKVLVFQP